MLDLDEIERMANFSRESINNGEFLIPNSDPKITEKIILNRDNKIIFLAEEIRRLRASNRGLRETLEFYAAPKSPSKAWPKGTRIEFGCRCCVGIIEQENGSVEYDSDICGLTAREALAKYSEEDGK